MKEYKQFDGTVKSAYEIREWSKDKVFLLTDHKNRFLNKIILYNIDGFLEINPNEYVVKENNKLTKSFNKPI